MPEPRLFTPLTIGGLTIPNRIVIAPMCQYSAEDGCMTDWHAMHLGQLAQSGAGMLTIEASAVVPEGRITYGDVGLYDDATEAAMAKVIAGIRRWSDMPIAIQLAHAGRKASCAFPWDGGTPLAPDHANGWQTEAPSAVPYDSRSSTPTALDDAGLARVRDAFVTAAQRADRLGIDAVQVHMAHGYLLHEFLSPLSNTRNDAYGGSLEGRARFPLEVLAAVRAAVPAHKPVTIRISVTDWTEGGFTLEEAVAFSKLAEAAGADAVDVSSGGLSPDQQIAAVPGYQVPLARAVKAAVSIPVFSVGLITEPTHAEAIIANGEADVVGLARTILYDPRWPWHAAAALGGRVSAAPQYLRCQPSTLKELFSLKPQG